jgi:hypothetical protein
MPTDAEIEDPVGYAHRAAAETVTVGAFYYYHDADRKEAARDALRRFARSDDFRHNNIEADVVIEQVWNALVGGPVPKRDPQ